MGVAGSNVRTVRQQLGMSLRAVADAAGLDPATLSRIENGKQNLTEELASKIAKALNVSHGVLFADPAVLEMSMLHMRKAPLLTAQQLLAWNGPDSFEEAPDQVYLHTGLDVGSRQMFAFRVTDTANLPHIFIGDVLLIDSKRMPRPGEVVLAQRKDGQVAVGRYRESGQSPAATFEVVPYDHFYPTARATPADLLVVRGVLAEQRRYFKS